MDFIDQIKQFSKRVDSLKDSLPTEEATKTSIIMPFSHCSATTFSTPMSLCPSLPPTSVSRRAKR